MSRQVFISHASTDASVALAICDGLESRGITCWIAPRDVAFDGTYGSEIVKGIRECDVFLIVVTSHAAASQQVEREAERASHYTKRIIPVIVGGADPGERLEYYVAGRQQFPCPAAPDERFFASLSAAIRPGGAREAVAAPPAPSPRRTLPPVWAWVATAVVIAAAVTAYLLSRDSDRETTAAVERSDATPADASASPAPPSSPAPNDPAARVTQSQTPGQVANRPTAGDSAAAPAAAGDKPAATPGAPPAARPPSSGGALAAVVNGAQLRFVALQAGSFRMGCSDGDTACSEDEKPVRRLSVDAFQMSATEVTQEFWRAVMGTNPSDFDGARQPVEHVSWQDAQGFVDRLNESGDGFRYRLPTEAEWEYAARAGGTTPGDLAAVAWFGLAQNTGRAPRPQNVGTKSPNAWGLYDMFGNVAEWCEDWYSPNYQRVVRGGAWDDGPTALRASARGKATPTTRKYSIGVRLVREPR